MDPLYQKISSLPEDTKTLLSSAQFLGQIEILENTYHLKLVSIGFGYIVGVITLAEVRAKLQQQNITDPNQDKIITILDTLAQQFSNLSSLPKKGKNSSKEASGVTFSSEDDEEINQIKQQAPTIATAAPNYEAQADAIIASFGYNETDDVMRKRLQTVIVARLRGVRDDLEAIDVLTKSKKVGGLEFTGDQATSLLRLMAGKSANGGWQIADG